jgi:hypothetical protein
MNTNIKPGWFRRQLSLLVCLLLPVAIAWAADPVPATAPTDAAGNFSGKVVDAISTAGYTYVQVDAGNQKIWAATMQFAVNKGDDVTVVGGVPMANFHSKTLGRDFDVVYFTGRIINNSVKTAAATPALPPNHPPISGAGMDLPPNHPPIGGQTAAQVDLADIQRADGGQTIAEIFASRAQLAGKAVTVRGKVVKYNAMILGKNWLHLRDGSGTAAAGDNDLTVTSATGAKLGDTVLVSGLVATNKDFGAGYKYTVILDDAKVVVE